MRATTGLSWRAALWKQWRTELPCLGEQATRCEAMRLVAQMSGADWSVEQTVLYGELHAARALLAVDEQPVGFGGMAQDEPEEDVTVRTAALDALVAEHVGSGAEEEDVDPTDDAMDNTTAIDSHGQEVTSHAHESDTGHAHESGVRQQGPHPAERASKFVRVDPPTVEDGPGEAVREDEPGYIAKAFPKLFPHGAGDYHHMRKTGEKLLSFPEWGRYVLMWHDGRFMRHTRFRYWLLDTVLRAKTPGMQRCFFRMRPGAADVTLSDLQGSKDERKN